MGVILQKLPYCISHFLGYRKPNSKIKSISQWRKYVWSFLASWIGIAFIEITFAYSPSLQQMPLIIASFGAGAVLVYGALEAPLAQPRNIFGGHLIGSIVGVSIAQIFLHIEHNLANESQYTAVRWVAGATAVALTLTLMQLTRTVHPPGGATALIAATTPTIVDISWLYIAAVMLSAVIQLSVACLLNNIEQRYPLYWWSPAHTPINTMPIINMETIERKNVATDTIDALEEGKSEERSETITVNDFDISENTSSLTEIEQAIRVLKHYKHHPSAKYCLFSPGHSLVTTPSLPLDATDKEIMDTLLNKVNIRMGCPY